MQHEFDENREIPPDSSSSSYASDSTSHTKSTNFDDELTDDSHHDSATDEGVEENVAHTEDNTADTGYDMLLAFSNVHYSKASADMWDIYSHHELIEEKNVDLTSFDKQNLVVFFKDIKIYTVSQVIPFSGIPVLEFYNNVTSQVGDERSARYGKVFVRGTLYSFSPATINDFCHTPHHEEEKFQSDIHFVTNVLTGGLVRKYPAHPSRLSTAKLTSL